MSGSFPAPNAETVERFGRPFRHFPVAVSSEAMALAWANTEDGPHGATVMVDHEIGPRGLHGRLWTVPMTNTLACSMVMRPKLSVEEGGVAWLLGSLVAADAAEAAIGRTVRTWWPDAVVEPGSADPLGAVRAEIQLGPGKVRCLVLTIRMNLAALGFTRERRDEVLEALAGAADRWHGELEADGPPAVAAAYENRCALIGERVRITLLPKGETRGVAKRVSRGASLELESPSGMVERIGVDQLNQLTVI